MEYRTFGRTGLRVSVCGLGGGGESRLGLKKGSTEDQAIARGAAGASNSASTTSTPRRTTAPRTSSAGRWPGCRDDVVALLQDRRPSGRRVAASPRPTCGGRWRGRSRKLRSDVVDVYHLHRVRPEDYEYAVAEIVPELLALRDEGKIRFLGISESTGSDARHSMLSRAVQDDVWDVVMTGFTFFNQSARDVLFPTTIAQGHRGRDHGLGAQLLQPPGAARRGDRPAGGRRRDRPGRGRSGRSAALPRRRRGAVADRGLLPLRGARAGGARGARRHGQPRAPRGERPRAELRSAPARGDQAARLALRPPLDGGRRARGGSPAAPATHPARTTTAEERTRDDDDGEDDAEGPARTA